MARPNDMPSYYSDNHILIWLSEAVGIREPRSDFHLIYFDMCEVFGLSEGQMKLRSRVREIIIPRYITMYVAVRRTSDTLKSIGAFFNTDHSTVSHAYNAVCDMLDAGDDLFITYWETFKMNSKYYSPELESPKRVEKRAAASMPAIKNDICGIFDLEDRDFIYDRGKKSVLARYIFCKVAIMVGHNKAEASRYLKQYAEYAFKSGKSLDKMFANQNFRLKKMWDKYVENSVLYNRVNKKKIGTSFITRKAA